MSTINVQAQTLAEARNLGLISGRLSQSFSRLSSGLRITAPSEDPAGVGSIATLDAQNKRTRAATTNVQSATSYVQSAVGFMSSMTQILSRMSELTRYAGDGLKSAGDLSLYQAEFKELQDQLRQTIGGTTAEIGGTIGITDPLGQFDHNILFGAKPAGLTIASGSHAAENIVIPETNLRDGAMRELILQDASGNYQMSVTDAGATQKITDAINDMAGENSVLAGIDSRLALAASSLTVESQNLSSAISRIQDVDVAKESTRLTKLNILMESGTAILTQANQSPKSVLKLLQA